MWRTSAVSRIPGEGNRLATIACLGEGLGEQEERSGRPFVGRAGDILNASLRDADLSREEVWLTNSARCRPITAAGKNRKPTATELGFCRGWLDDELATLPNLRVIVALGASAAWSALAPHVPTGGVLENQGRALWSERYHCWVITTLHPAYALRKPAEQVWITLDLLKAKRIAQHGQPAELQEPNYRVVETEDDAFEMREDVLASSFFVWDWETTGLHPALSQGFCVSVCTDRRPDFAWVLPLAGQRLAPIWRPTVRRRLVDEVLRPIFLSDIPKGGHHVAFDINITETTVGVRPVNVTTCTMIAHHLPNNHYPERAHGLKRMSDIYTPYGRYDDPLDAWLIENGHTRDGKADGAFIYCAPSPIVHKYSATDSIVAMFLKPIVEQQVREAGLWDVYEQERIPLMLSYAEKDRMGVRINEERLDRLGKDLDLAIDLVESRLHQVTGLPDFNANSPQQVVKYLYEERGLPVTVRTETGAPSTKEEVLKQFEDQEPAVPLILYRRGYGKLKGTFVDGNRHHVGGLKAVVDADHRARMSTMLTVVETFRLATRKPFPIHTIPRPLVLWTCQAAIHGHYLFERCCPFAKKVSLSIRSLVIPDDNYRFAENDYRQQEYAIGAIISHQQDWEEAMLDRGEDAHEYVMGILFQRSKSEFADLVNGEWEFHSKQAAEEYKNLRSTVKQTNFMIFFRGGARKLAQRLSDRGDPKTGRPPRVVDEDEAASLIEDYYERLPNFKWWQYETIKRLRATGMSVSPFGTRRKLPGIYSADRFDQYEAERQACNFPIQCSGYHVMVRGMLRLEARWAGKLPLRAPFPGRVVFTIHDELVAQIRWDLMEEGLAGIKEEMERPHAELVGGCGIPRGILVDQKVTDAWGGLDKEESRHVPMLVPSLS